MNTRISMNLFRLVVAICSTILWCLTNNDIWLVIQLIAICTMDYRNE